FFLAIIAAGIFVFGIVTAMGKNLVKQKELTGMIVVILILAILIGLTSLTSDKMGSCYKKSYNQFTQPECENAPTYYNVEWAEERCRIRQDDLCDVFGDENMCANSGNLACRWFGNPAKCKRNNCQILEQSECKEYDNMKCKWQEQYGRCMDYDACGDYHNQYESCSQQQYCQWNSRASYRPGGKDIPLIIWGVWIVINFAFILIILAVMGYGKLMGNTSIINIAIAFFALDIITRYIGFLMNFWGYMSLAIVFITGGLILVVGGFLIEKWRRKLIKKTESTKD
ncbi:hypothetical protein ACFL6I_28720, partial [candidate division KSB1 bacterium]